MIGRHTFAGITVWALLLCPSVLADELRIAVASNFSTTLAILAKEFETQTQHQTKLIRGSTGKLYAQLVNGAPYDVFLAADARRPMLLEEKAFGVSGTRVTYAQGQLVLWSANPDLIDGTPNALSHDYRYLALANPRLAPYGRASEQVLRGMGLWTDIQAKLVFGENIAQTFHFVQGQQAELGFVAYSQILTRKPDNRGSYWHVPQSQHDPIEQQMILIKDTPASRQFLAFMDQSKARDIITAHGYTIPDAD